MKQPDSRVYEQELEFMPYRDSLKVVISRICNYAPRNATLVDLMCGPGYLLGQLSIQRPDLYLLGVDKSAEYVHHAEQRYGRSPGLTFEVGDVLSWQPGSQFDIVSCTGALHHIPYSKQETVVKKMASLLSADGFGILSDCYIGDYKNERERRLAAAKLGYEYLAATIANGAPPEVIQATADILVNDVMRREFKTSLRRRLTILRRHFACKASTKKIWPNNKWDFGYGDYVTVLRKYLS
jgi:2-polyprenyl-3-methyl-5-hydroxy-6-metoxy-1,4-benzoquinol methylase